MRYTLALQIKIKLLALSFLAVSAQSWAQQPQAQGTTPMAAEATKAETVAPIKTLVFSFLEWKSMRVHEAQKKLEAMGKGAGTPGAIWQEGKSIAESDEVSRNSEQKLNFNVEVALQLNIHDYFSMYLKTLTPEEFKEATKKLSEDEKSELLLAYKNSTEKEKKVPLKFSKIPKDNAKSKNTEIQ